MSWDVAAPRSINSPPALTAEVISTLRFRCARFARHLEALLCATSPASGVTTSMQDGNYYNMRAFHTKVDSKWESTHQSPASVPMQQRVCQRLLSD
jgi:hypothetical protein